MIQQFNNYIQQLYTQLSIPDMSKIPWKFSLLNSSFFASVSSNHSIHVPFTKYKQVIICDVRDFYQQHQDNAQIYLYEHLQKFPFDHKWNVFAHVYAKKQWVVYVKPHAQINDPFVLNLDNACTENVTIIIAQGSQVTIHEHMFAKRGKRIKNVEVIIEQGANLIFIGEYNDTHEMHAYLQYRFFVYDNAQLSCNFALVGGKTTMINIDVQLCAEGAQADIKGLYVVDDNRQFIVSTRQRHTYKNTISNVVMKGIVTDTAHAVYYGTIAISKNAPRTEAYQENKNIVLSKCTKVFSQPNLEIQTDDVRCKHGSAIGKFDADQLLYLQSRGLSLKLSRQLLLKAFIADVNHPLITSITMPQ